MKRSYLKRNISFRPSKSPIPRRTPLKRSTRPVRRGRVRLVGHSTISEQKAEIQALLRKIVMLRDRGCILRMERNCGGELDTPGVVLQADHLITRANSATYADPRLVVCLCRRCHGWKSLGSNLRKAEYDALVKTILPEARVKLWEQCEKDSWRPNPKRSYDWALEIVALRQELEKLKLGITA